MTQEKIIQEGLELSEQFTQTYYSTHRLVRTFQRRNYQAFLEALSEVENVSPQLSQTVKTFIKNKQLIENMNTGSLSNGPIEGISSKRHMFTRTENILSSESE